MRGIADISERRLICIMTTPINLFYKLNTLSVDLYWNWLENRNILHVDDIVSSILKFSYICGIQSDFADDPLYNLLLEMVQNGNQTNRFESLLKKKRL